MNVTPSLAEFERLAKSYNVIPLTHEVVVDRDTPVSLYERLSLNEPHAFLLESVEGGERFGRYSYIGRRPYAVFRCENKRVTYREGKSLSSWITNNPVEDLRNLFGKFRAAPVAGLPRFSGGAVGYWDYDVVRFFERLPDSNPDLLGLPQGAFQLTRELIVLDRMSQTAQIICNLFIPDGGIKGPALERLYRSGLEAIAAQLRDIHANPPPAKGRSVARPPRPPRALVSRSDYIAGVRRAQEHIRAGDIIQVVLSQRWMFEPGVPPFQVYRALRLVNPSPYMYCLHFPDMDIVGSSPELLVRKEGQVAETRPIAGTRPRGKDSREDERLAQDLLKDPKERAEHLMLVDLGRNDLGRVCRPGSVRVPEFMLVENYSHVMHLVSSVEGKLSRRANAFDLFQACFPAGTVAGAPKVRAMEIIDDLESMKRGPYAGALGYFAYNGDMDLAITIRTLVFRDGKAYLQAGAGIVADSVPEREFRECEQKAAALFLAIRKARELP